MKRNTFIKAFGISLGAGFSLAACTSPTSKADGSEKEVDDAGTIIHSVYFWLRDGLTEDEHADFLNFFEALMKVPGIYRYQIGKPAPTTARDVVDNSFSYNWIATFRSLEDINTYEKHPDHIAAAEKYAKYWTKVEVRDTVL